MITIRTQVLLNLPGLQRRYKHLDVQRGIQQAKGQGLRPQIQCDKQRSDSAYQNFPQDTGMQVAAQRTF